MSDEKKKLEEEMMTVSAVAGIGAGGKPNDPNLPWRDEPGRNPKLIAFKRMLARKRSIW